MTTHTAKRQFTPADWQRNPDSIDTDKVQFWREGIMITAMMSKTTAQELVKDGKAFVMTGQAIGALKLAEGRE